MSLLTLAATLLLAAPRFDPGGPLPQHRGMHLGGHWVETLQWTPGGLLIVAQDALLMMEAEQPWSHPPKWKRPHQEEDAVALSAAGDVLFAEYVAKAKVRLSLIAPGQKAARTVEMKAHPSLTFCGRLPVLGAYRGQALSYWKPSGLEAIEGAPGEIRSLACAAGRLAVGVTGGVRVLTRKTGHWSPLLPAADEFQKGPDQVALSADGRWLAANAHRGEVWLWRADTLERVAQVPRIGGQAADLVFSPDSKQLAVGRVRLSVPELKLLDRWQGDGPEGVAWSPDGRWLAFGAGPTLRLLDLAGRGRMPTPRGASSTIRAMAVSHDRLFTLDEQAWLLGWSLDPLRVIDGFQTGEWGLDVGRRLATRPDGTLLIGCDNAVQRWTVGGQRLEFRSHPGHSGDGLSLDRGAARIALAASNEVFVIDWESGETLLRTPGYKKPGEAGDGSVESASLHPDGRQIAVGGRRATHVLEVASGKEVARLPSLKGYDNQLRFDPTGAHLVHTSSMEGRLYAWPGLKLVTKLPAGGDRHSFTKDGRMLSSDWGGALSLVSLRSGKTLWSVGGPWHVGASAIDPRQRLAYSSGPDLNLIAWDLKTGEERFRRPGGAGRRATGLAFSPDGASLALGSAGGDLFVFDVRRHTGRVLDQVKDAAFEDLSFGPHGPAALSYGPTLHRWRRGKREDHAFAKQGAQGTFGGFTREGVAVVGHQEEALWIHLHGDTGRIRTRKRRGPLSDFGRVSPDGAWWLHRERDWDTRRDTLRLSNLKSGKSSAPFALPGEVEVLGWVGDTVLAFAHHMDEHGVLYEWKAGGKAPTQRKTPPWFPVPLAASSKHLASAHGHSVLLVGRGDLKVRHVFIGHEVRVDRAAFSPDGARLATADFRGHVWLWDLQTGKALARYVGAVGGAWNAWSAKGWREAGWN